MKEKNIYIKTLQLLVLIPLYYIIGKQSIFTYTLSICLYNVFLACFSHISIKESLNKIKNSYDKRKLLNITILTISVITSFFLLLNLLASDILTQVLKINNLFIIFLTMGISIIAEPVLNILTDYLEEFKNKKIHHTIFNFYYIIETILTLIISIFTFRIFKLKNSIAVASLYIPKILSILIVSLITYGIIFKKNNVSKKTSSEYNYRLELKKILTKNHHKSIIEIVKKSYYYISIIILYIVLKTRYNYAINEIQQDITFIYFYGISIINYIIYIVNLTTKKIFIKKTPFNQIYIIFKIMLPTAIIFGITSPLICKTLFNDSSKSIYLMMLNFMAIFLLLHDTTLENIKNKKLLYISASTGIILKLILTIPLINSFYRIGYNLIYGDIISTIISLLTTTIINYIYLKTKYRSDERYLDKFLKTVYENIILCIILIIMEFLIPIETNNYLKSLGLMIVYLSISIMYINIKNKKRG